MSFCTLHCSDNRDLIASGSVTSLALLQEIQATNPCTKFISVCKLWILLQLFFRGKVQDEQGYVLYVRKNALQILIPKYGLEGTLYVTPHKGQKLNATFVYSDEVLYHVYV
jgi:exosome complex exonuclease DIS3/RRP44